MIDIGVVGAAGKMGRWIVKEILARPDICTLAGATEAPDSPFIDLDAAEIAGLEPANVRITGDTDGLFRKSDVVIDFTTPVATLAHAELAARNKKALVVGTTGLTAQQEQQLRGHSAQAPVVYSSNMSVGVNLLIGLVEQTAARLGTEYDIEIFEAHHKLKKDAPSGTALSLGHAAATGRQRKFDDIAVYDRNGLRPAESIGFSVMRGGDIVGEHTVTFAGTGERIELGHRATSREIFAQGAIRAALWVSGKPAKLYTMRDVLGI